MNKEYVKQYAQLEREHWWFVVRQKIILYFLHKHVKTTGLRILNIGAAGGASSKWLGELGEVVSLETDILFLEQLRSAGIDAIESSVISMPFADNSFDLVCAFDVIEHVEDDNAALAEMNRVCRKQGLLCVTVPAFQSLWGNHDVVNRHFRRYTKSTLLNRLNNLAGTSLLEMAYFNSLLFVPVFFARKISSLLPRRHKEEKADFTLFKTTGAGNKILKKIFSLELSILPKFKIPFGVSLLAVLKKN